MPNLSLRVVISVICVVFRVRYPWSFDHLLPASGIYRRCLTSPYISKYEVIRLGGRVLSGVVIIVASF